MTYEEMVEAIHRKAGPITTYQEAVEFIRVWNGLDYPARYRNHRAYSRFPRIAWEMVRTGYSLCTVADHTGLSMEQVARVLEDGEDLSAEAGIALCLLFEVPLTKLFPG